MTASKIEISAAKTASNRTKNRLHENGAVFEFVSQSTPPAMQSPSILVRSTETGWFGWFPLNEITFKHVEDGADA